MTAGIALFVPFSGFVLDRLGYGLVLITINITTLAFLAFQLTNVLQLQVCCLLRIKPAWQCARNFSCS